MTDSNIKMDDRNPDATDSRTLLSNVLSSSAQNEIEKNYIEQYQETIGSFNAEQNKLTEIRAEIYELSSAEGEKDMDKLRKLKEQAAKSANRIDIYDKQILELAATKPLKDVLDRERALAKKREEQRSREALKAYREEAFIKQQELLDRYHARVKESKEQRDKIKETEKMKNEMIKEEMQQEKNETGKKTLSLFLSFITFVLSMIISLFLIILIINFISKIPLLGFLAKLISGTPGAVYNPWFPTMISMYISYGVCAAVSEKISNNEFGLKLTSFIVLVIFSISLVLNIVYAFSGSAGFSAIVSNIISVLMSWNIYKNSSWD